MPDPARGQTPPQDQEPVRDRDAVEVKITVQPPEVFEGNEKAITYDIAVTDKFVLAYQLRDQFFQYVLYDATGKPVKDEFPSGFFEKFYTSKVLEIAQGSMRGLGSIYPSHQNLNEVSYKSINIFIKKIFPSFSDEQIRFLIKRFDSRFPNGYQCNTDVASDRNFILFYPQVSISSDSTRKVFVLSDGTNAVSYPTEEKGVAINPKKMDEGCYPFKLDASPIGEAAAVKEFLTTTRGTPVPGTDVAASCERGVFNIVNVKTGDRLFSDSAVGFVFDRVTDGVLYYLDQGTNQVCKMDAKKLTLGMAPDVERTVLPFQGIVKDFTFDQNGNFFLVLVEVAGKSTLKVLEKDTMRVAYELEGVKSTMDLDSVGNLYFIDEKDRLRLANTNFAEYPKGGLEGARAKRTEKLRLLRERLEKGINIKKTTPAADEETALIDELKQKLDGIFGTAIQDATTTDELNAIGAQMESMAKEDEWKAYPSVFDRVKDRLVARDTQMKTDRLDTLAVEAETLLDSVSGPDQLMDLDRIVSELRATRRTTPLRDAKARKAVDERLKQIEMRQAEVIARERKTIQDLLPSLFDEWSAAVRESATREELTEMQGSQEALRLEGAFSLLGRETASEWKGKRQEVIARRETELRSAEMREEEQRRVEQAERVEQARELLREIESAFDTQVTDPRVIDRWLSGNPLVKRFRAVVVGLPDDLRRDEDQRFETWLKEKRRDFIHRDTLHIPKHGEEVDFGEAKFPVFHAPKTVWRPKIESIAEGSAFGRLVFEDSFGRRFEPAVGAVPIDEFNEDTQATIRAFEQNARTFFDALKREVPRFDERWVLTPHFRSELSGIARLFKTQMENQEKILILEGEAGVGKNVLIDMFAHFTNREVFTFSCNFQTEKEDLTYAFKFEPSRGTYTVDSRLITALQTPGCVIMLDEINTLPPGVTKMLNPLFDYRRCLNLPDGRVIKTHPSVLLVGAMNPQNYLGVKPLAQEVKSRARFKPVDYPPERRNNAFAHDEAAVLAKYIPGLSDLSAEAFAALWDLTINNNRTAGGDRHATAPRVEACKKLREIIKTASRVRDAYRAFRTGASNDPIEFVFSMRETTDIALEIAHQPNLKKAIQNVVLPKIGDPEERERVKVIIDNA